MIFWAASVSTRKADANRIGLSAISLLPAAGFATSVRGLRVSRLPKACTAGRQPPPAGKNQCRRLPLPFLSLKKLLPISFWDRESPNLSEARPPERLPFTTSFFLLLQRMKNLKTFEKGVDLTAKTLAGLENVLADELKALGAGSVEPGNRVVFFRGDKVLMYKANYLCRTALRVLKPIGIFTVKNEQELYEKVKRIDWPALFDVKKTFVVSASVFHSSLTNSLYVALKTKDAIADQFREKMGKRPFVSKDNAQMHIDVHISQDECTISLDSSEIGRAHV